MKKVPVSERALVARIDRAMAKNGETLKRCREDSRWFNELGRYYTVNVSINGITDKHVDLEKLGRKMGVLSEYETLGKDR